MNTTLIIIPARGGSKAIPQKNIKLLNGKPLIYYAIKNSRIIPDADVIVSTDDELIATIAGAYGVDVLARPEELADDLSTIDQVACHALKTIEIQNHIKYQTVITLQPTSPLLEPESLLEAYHFFQNDDLDTIVSVSENLHLNWINENDRLKPLFAHRVNRQLLSPVYQETGAFVICEPEIIRHKQTRFGDKISIYPLSSAESIDIDSFNDWILAENLLRRKNIAFVTNGSLVVGMGHIHRSLTLSSHLYNHNTFFFSHTDCTLGIDKLTSLNYQVHEFTDFDSLIKKLKAFKIDIVINDILDTDEEYIHALKDSGFFVVNFEDTGSGASKCDLLFNALYEWSGTSQNSFFGYKYECLRDDIYMYPIRKTASTKLSKLLISCGGVDFNNATLTLIKLLSRTLNTHVHITLILGIGYKHEKELHRYLSDCPIRDHITIKKNVRLMAKYIHDADLVISTNGRMIYEVVSLAVPLIVCSQNEREMSHIFPSICSGITYLGNVDKLDRKKFKTAFEKYFDDQYRQKMNQELVPYAIDLRKGARRIVNLIHENFFERFNNENQNII